MPSKIVLDRWITVNLYPKAPFSFDPTFHKPDHFPSGDTMWEEGARWQSMLWQNELLGLIFRDKGSVNDPEIQLSIWSSKQLTVDYLTGLIAEITYRYNLQMDLAPFIYRFQKDPLLGPIIHRWPGMRPMHPGSLYEYLMIAIVLQNTTVRRSVAMLQVLFEMYGTLVEFDGKQLFCFWSPSQMDEASEEDLRSLKLGYRAKSIKRVTTSFVLEAIDEVALRESPQEEQRQALINLYGIGPASVWYILFDVFHRMDEINYISPWEQKIYTKLFFNQNPDNPVPVDQLLSLFSDRFGEFRMLAVHYIWEGLFWERKNQPVDWLEKMIRL